MTDHNKVVSRLRISGSDLRQMLEVGTSLLQENVELVNALNVFPVPDGDTGTNMLLTMQSALEEIARVDAKDVGASAKAAAHGSLMGARGNSGVILSQILRGLARSTEGKDFLDGADLAAALKEGANTAYRGIGKPVEGTMLTVARESADAALAAAQEERNVAHVLRRAVEEGRRSLEATPELLPTLKEAGVVDAGGQGYLLLLEGAQMFISGERTAPPVASVPRVAPVVTIVESSQEFGFCTEVLVRGDRLDVEGIRGTLEKMGDSVLVVGEPDLIHLHVHTHRPGDILNLATTLGNVEKVKVENMQLQHTAYMASVERAEQSAQVDGVGVVPVAAGVGLARVFKDLGASSVVHGGQTMNPSIEELVHGAAHSGFGRVILLPNNPNVVMTAQQAQSLAKMDLRVVPTRTICEGIAAMVAFNPEMELDANVAAMVDAASHVQSIEITRAVRSSKVNGLQVEVGQAIAMLNGVLVETGAFIGAVAVRALEQARAAEHEVVTVYCGEGVTLEEGQELGDSISGALPNLEVEVVEGGQPHYPFIISVE
jgi:uncharacterized protein